MAPYSFRVLKKFNVDGGGVYYESVASFKSREAAEKFVLTSRECNTFASIVIAEEASAFHCPRTGKIPDDCTYCYSKCEEMKNG